MTTKRCKIPIKKLIKRAVGVMFALFILSHIVPVPIRINAPAYEVILNDPYHSVERQVVIRGWYWFRIISRYDVFRGTIEISGYPQSYGANLRVVIPWQRNQLAGTRAVVIWYFGNEDLFHTQPIVYSVLYTFTMFRELIIQVTDHGLGIYSSHDSPHIVLNAPSSQLAWERVLNVYTTDYWKSIQD